MPLAVRQFLPFYRRSSLGLHSTGSSALPAVFWKVMIKGIAVSHHLHGRVLPSLTEVKLERSLQVALEKNI